MNRNDAMNFTQENEFFRMSIVVKGILIIIGSYALLGLMAYYFYNQEKEVVIEKFQQEGVSHTLHHKQIISHELKQSLQNLLFLKEQLQFQDAFDERVGSTHAEEDLLAFMNNAVTLDQVRLIDNVGQEFIRINKTNQIAEIVPKGRLQKKSNRYYMQEIMKLKQGDIYISKLDLNMEFGQVELPFKPVIRLGIGVYDHEGNRRGSLILNYLAAEMLNILEQSGLSMTGDMFLLNAQGYYLSSPDKTKVWGFMFEDKASASLASEAPEVWKIMMGADEGSVFSGNQIYTFASIYPYQEMKIVGEPTQDLTGKQVWKVVSYYGESHIEAAMEPYRKSMLNWLSILGLIVFLVAWPLSFLMDRRTRINEHLQLLSNAMEHTGESVFITNPKGVIEYINPSFTSLTGYSMDEAVGHTPADLLKSTAQSGEFYADMWQTISRGEVWHGKLIDKRKDGSFYPSVMSISPVKNTKGDITHYIGIQSDDTLSKLAIERELHIEKMKIMAVAVGGIAHEFNNILTGILGNAFLVKMKGAGNEDIISKLESIELLGRKAAHMVSQMMTYVGNDLHTPKLQSIDVNELCKEVITISNSQLGITCKFEPCDESVVIDGEEARLADALSNLLSNAADAVRCLDDGLVTIVVKRVRIERAIAAYFGVNFDQDYVRIEVVDNGSGVLKEHQEIIFEPFFTTKEVGQGTGLGLSAVYGIAKDHRGFIQLDKEREHGCSFQMYLPLKQ